MLEVLTGSGLALSAGLNAFIPLLAMGALARFTDLVALPIEWQWLENGWVLVVLAVLLTLEVVADKVPAVDHVNDVIQTVVRPTSGGIVFAAGSSSQTPAITDPGEFFTSAAVWPFVVGVLIALSTHLAKASGRAVVNLSTAGVGAPVVSTVEDVSAATMTLLAILVPVLVVVFLVVLVFLAVVARSRLARRRRTRAATGH